MQKIKLLFVFVALFALSTSAQNSENNILYEKGKLSLSTIPNGGISFGNHNFDYFFGLNIKPLFLFLINLMRELNSE